MDCRSIPLVLLKLSEAAQITIDAWDYQNAQQRYQGIRDASYDLTWNQLKTEVPLGCDIKVMPLDERALAFWHAIKHFGAVETDGGFPWDDIYQQVVRTPRRFDVAIWDGDILCGLAVGMASRGRENVTIRWIERFHPPNRLKGFIAQIALTAADHYGYALGCKRLLLRHPLPGAVPLYEAFGFSLATKRFGAIYYERDIV